jgi:hypothetical protein
MLALCVIHIQPNSIIEIDFDLKFSISRHENEAKNIDFNMILTRYPVDVFV